MVSVVGLKVSEDKVASQPRRTLAQLIGGIIFLIVVLILNVVFIRFLFNTMSEVDNIPIRKIQVEGDLKILSKSDIEAYYSKNPKNYNIVTVDLAQVKEYMETLPWINAVYLKKRHPDILMIYVVEHEPLTLYNNGVLTTQWHIIYPDIIKCKKNLVQLKGPVYIAKDPGKQQQIDEEIARAVFDRYRIFSSVLSGSNFIIKKLELTDNYIWELELTNGVLLKLGRDMDSIDAIIRDDDVLAGRLKLFVESFPYIESKDLIEYIDLRYDNGMAVKYKNIEKQDDSKQ